MLFFLILHRHVWILFICYTLITVTNAFSSRSSKSSSSSAAASTAINSPQLMFDEQYERTQRGTGFFVYRKGEYLFFFPDRKHHFSKTIRPYIGRRR